MVITFKTVKGYENRDSNTTEITLIDGTVVTVEIELMREIVVNADENEIDDNMLVGD